MMYVLVPVKRGALLTERLQFLVLRSENTSKTCSNEMI